MPLAVVGEAGAMEEAWRYLPEQKALDFLQRLRCSLPTGPIDFLELY